MIHPTLPVTRYAAPFDASAAIIAAELRRLRAASCECFDPTERRAR